MKILFASILSFIFCIQNASAGAADKDKTLESIVELNGYTKDQIYTGAKSWLAETFVSSKAVIELDDKENGKIIGKVIIDMVCNDGYWSCLGISGNLLNANLRIDIKDGKYRLSLSKMTWTSPPTSTSPGHLDVEFYSNEKVDEMKPTLQHLSDELKRSILTETATQTGDIMALINCEECNKEISDKAAACPHCGAPNAKLAATTASNNLCPKCNIAYVTEQKTMTSAVLILTIPMFIGGAITMMSNILIGGIIIFAAFAIDYMGRNKKTVLVCPKCQHSPS